MADLIIRRVAFMYSAYRCRYFLANCIQKLLTDNGQYHHLMQFLPRKPYTLAGFGILELNQRGKQALCEIASRVAAACGSEALVFLQDTAA